MMCRSIIDCYKRSFVFKGQSDKHTFVAWTLFAGTVLLCGILWLSFLFHGINYTESMKGWNLVYKWSLYAVGLFAILSVIPTLSLCVRRLRSIGWSPLIVLVPLIALIVVIYFGLMAGFANMDGVEPSIPYSSMNVIVGVCLVIIIAFILALSMKKDKFSA